MSENDDRDFTGPESQDEAKPSRCWVLKVPRSRVLMKAGASGILGLALTLGTLGCTSSTDPSKTDTLNLAGDWSGTAGDNNSPMKATLTQNGSTLGGTITYAYDMRITGTVSGSISGSVVDMTWSFPAGSFAPEGSATCSMTAAPQEKFKVTATLIKKIFEQYWSASCVPTIAPQAATGVQVTLTKQ
jgi:hypothetical protein